MAAPRRRGPHKLCKHLISTFYKTTNAPAPPLLCLVRNRRGRGGRGETGHTLIFVPLFVQSFVVVVVIIFLCWRRNTIEPRERKTGHVKTGYFHDNERKQHHIHGGRVGGDSEKFGSRHVVRIHRYHVFPSLEYESCIQFFLLPPFFSVLCWELVGVEFNVDSSKPHNLKVSLHNLFMVPVRTGFGGHDPRQTYRHIDHQLPPVRTRVFHNGNKLKVQRLVTLHHDSCLLVFICLFCFSFQERIKFHAFSFSSHYNH